MSIDFLKAKALTVDGRQLHTKASVPLNASKSETNRALMIQALSGNPITLNNLAIARDSQTMQKLVSQPQLDPWDVLDAGTTMRFLTAFLAMQQDTKTITGTARMQQRPINPLVDALRTLGAEIEYLKNENYPPLKITGMKSQLTRKISIPGNISSQYISALLMIGPLLPEGIEIELTSEVYSRPYIEMTLGLMAHFGVTHEWTGQTISIAPQEYQSDRYTIESDWSGASYWYSIAALSGKSTITLGGLKEKSFQGDQEIAWIMERLGVTTSYTHYGVVLLPGKANKQVSLDFRECPDLAQTVMAVASVKGTKLHMTGLESLKIKETDRILAMQKELAKIGGELIENGNEWTLIPGGDQFADNVVFDTYEDHRMAMALAPLGIVKPVVIQEPGVVVKSYPDYWAHLDAVGFSLGGN